MNKWDNRFSALAEHVAQWSKDPSTKVGAVIVDARRRVIGLGYNGFPRGVRDAEERYAEKRVKYALVVHAELNALMNSNFAVRDCDLYTTMAPCTECTKAIIQAGIIRVISPEWRLEGRWAEESSFCKQMFIESGVELCLHS